MTAVVLCVQNLGVPDDPRVWNEACALAADGFAVTVVAPRSGGQPGREQIEGVDVVRYRRMGGGSSVCGQLVEVAAGFASTAFVVWRLRRTQRIDVLHVANPPDTLFPLARLLRRVGTRFVYDQHDAAPELAVAKLGRHPLVERTLRWLERRSYGAADLVIVSNNSLRRRAIAAGVAPHDVVTIRLGPPTAEGAAPPPPVPTVVYAGVMGRQDAVDVLIDGYAEVARDRPGATRLVLVGHGDAVRMLRRRVAAHGIGDDVTWTGWLPRPAVRERLRTATVGVSPDVDDAYSRLCTMIKVSEYLTAGVPAIVADLPENRATAGDAASYYRAGDVGELASRLEDALFDPDHRRALAEAAARRGPALLWGRSAERLTGAYHHLLHGAPPVEGDQHVDDACVATAR